MKKPNIILIQADQMAGPALPMYGHKVVKAPNLQKLAETGTTFNIDRTYTTKKLNFNSSTKNSIDTVSDRDFVLDFL